jgi:hypothetical protein
MEILDFLLYPEHCASPTIFTASISNFIKNSGSTAIFPSIPLRYFLNNAQLILELTTGYAMACKVVLSPMAPSLSLLMR